MKKKDLDIQTEPWVMIRFTWHLPGDFQNRHEEYVIDMPRHMLEKWRWYIRWRGAWLVCKNPRVDHDLHWCFYDKKSGIDIGFGSLMAKLSGHKAQITRIRNRMAIYKSQKSQTLFYDLDNDEQWQKALAKLKEYEDKADHVYRLIKEEISKKNTDGQTKDI